MAYTTLATPITPFVVAPFGLFSRLARSYSMAQRYEHLFNLSDADLAARGMTRADLTKAFIDEANLD